MQRSSASLRMTDVIGWQAKRESETLFFSGDDEVGGMEESALDLGVGKHGEGLAGRLGVAGGLIRGVFEGAVAVEDGEDLGVRDAVEGAIAEDGFDLAALGGGATLERMNDGHGGFAFAQIAGHWLAQDAFGGGEVEDIVDNLEGHAEIASVLAEALFLGCGGAAENAASPHADGEQAGGFAIDQVEILVQRDWPTELLHLEQFALDHLLGEFGEHVEDAEIALLHGDAEGLHIEPVAGEDTHGVAPLGVGGGTAAAGLGVVDDIVVDERGGVDDLDDGSELHRAIASIAEEFGGEQQERGADALAAASAQILADFGDGGDVGDGVAPELPFDGCDVVAQKVEDFFTVDGRGCRQCAQLLR